MGLFGTPFTRIKPKQYEYLPRHFDPRKEELHERLRQIEMMKGDSPEAVKSRIAYKMRKTYSKESVQYRKKQVFQSNMRLVFLLGLLLVGCYIFLAYYLPVILKAVGK